MFKPLLQKLPVTALCLAEGYLFAGHGGKLQIFQLFSDGRASLVKELQLFKNSVVHGIKKYTTDCHGLHIIVFGGKDVSVLDIDLDNKDFKEIYHFSANDWILDVAFIQETKLSEPYVALALAHNSVVYIDPSSSAIIRETHCVEKCILYSAHFVQYRANDQDKLILCAGTVFNQIVIWKPPSTHVTHRVEILERIDGHDGVIFHISYDHDMKLLFSASDDRSIRIWKSASLLQATDDTHTCTECLCVLYGHQARVWNLVSICRGGLWYMISASEDGFSIVWKLDGLAHKATVVKKINCKANVLSLATDNDQFALGCMDGSIRTFNFQQAISHHCVKQVELPDQDVGVPKTVRLLVAHRMAVLVHSDNGTLLCYHIHQARWSILHTDDNYGSYATMEVNQTENYIAIGNTKGHLKVVHIDGDYDIIEHKELQLFHHKVLSLSWFNDNLFVSGPSGRLLWLKVTCQHGLEASHLREFVLPPAKHRWHVDVLVHAAHVVCGDRRGSLHLFHHDTPHPISTEHGVHGKHGVTSLTKLQDGRMITTGRDGYWRMVDVGHDGLKVATKHRASQGMDWIEGCDVDGDGRLFFHGFHGNKFVVWSKYSGDDLFSVMCGGCHRSWGFSLLHSTLVYLKAGTINIIKTATDIAQESIVSPALHCQQTTAVKLIGRSADNLIQYCATSGDDTKVIVSALVTSGPTTQLEVLHILDDHSSNVRTLAVLPIKEDDINLETLLYSAGGRATMNVYSIVIKKDAIKPNCRVEHIASYGGEGGACDMRYMALVAWMDGDGRQMAAVSCSDGRVRCMEIKHNAIDITNESKEHRHCFLTLTRVRGLLVAGSTDGNLYFMTSTMEELFTRKSHQSGINAIATFELEVAGSRYVLVGSGGDDNAIQFVLFRCDDGFREVASCREVNAHATQITGLQFRQPKDHVISMNREISVTTASIDQRVVTWRLNISDELTLKCDKVHCYITHVADAAGMDFYGRHFLLCGRGLLYGVTGGHDAPIGLREVTIENDNQLQLNEAATDHKDREGLHEVTVGLHEVTMGLHRVTMSDDSTVG